MRKIWLTTSPVLWLGMTAATLAEGGPTTFEDVFVAVDGRAVQVPAGLAAEACDLDDITVQQVAATLFEETGLDPLLVFATSDGAAAADALAPDDEGEEGGAVTVDAGAEGDLAREGEVGTDGLRDVELTAAETDRALSEAPGAPASSAELEAQFLSLAVCELDSARALQLGLSGEGD